MLEHEEQIRNQVREGYAKIAMGEEKSCCKPTCCGGGGAKEDRALKLAQTVGYSMDELEALPEGANMGLSCGNPVALATLKEGEVVLDLGSGGGFDAFIAGGKVGAAGRVIGVDMTAEMIGKARRNTAGYRERTGLDNVEFRLGEIEHLPVADASVDVVMSNCVINLSPEKAQVWREIGRVLKPGGRVSVSDIALLQPLPEAARKSVEALVGCMAGAVLVDETRAMIEAAGLEVVALVEKPGYVESMEQWEEPLYGELAANLPAGTRPSDFATSLSITARKSF